LFDLLGFGTVTLCCYKEYLNQRILTRRDGMELVTRSNLEIVGRGTWLDMVARRVLERETKLGRKVDVLRTESGLGASGLPHIGSLGDVIRAYGIKLALDSDGA